VVSIPPGITLGMAGIHASLHSIRILANNGLVSPREIDESLDGVTETLENLPQDLLALIQPTLDPLLAEIKQAAAANWKGE
jgi:hypothetical protein